MAYRFLNHRRVNRVPEAYTKDRYLISTDPSKLDVGQIHEFLTTSYWAAGISRAAVQKAIQNSLCFGIYCGSLQIGFARVITDHVRIGYLADVFILEPYRGRGLCKWLMECIMAHPELQKLTKWLLATKDAHGLYEKYGFRTLAPTEIEMMMIREPDN